MIVVIGSPLHRPGAPDRPSGVGGFSAAIAIAAATAGRPVQLVGRVGDDPAGDLTLQALGRDGVGHVAMLRDAARATAVAPPPGDADEPPDADQSLELAVETALAESAAGLPTIAESTLDRGDLELALRYLTGFSVVVVAEALDPEALAVVAEAAAYVGATVLVLAAAGGTPMIDGGLVIEAPERDPEGVFARTIGSLAAAIDGGATPSEALATVTAAQGWDRTED